MRDGFEREYRRTFGHALTGHPIDFVALRVVATVPPPDARRLPRLRRRGEPRRAQMRQAYFGREFGALSTPVVDRWDLGDAGAPGPLIVEEYEGTTVVPPGARAARDEFDNIVITMP